MASTALPLRIIVLAALVFGAAAASAPTAAAVSHGAGGADAALDGWSWPTTPARIVAPFVAPAHDYGPGHRGIDLAAPVGSEVSSPAAGVVAFAGSVAGRGIVTIDHGDGLVTTLEPVHALVGIGTVLARGEVVASVDVGGHSAPGTVHFGVREEGEYINPMLMIGIVPRAVLLPCC